MKKYFIRANKNYGQSGHSSENYAWSVYDGGVEDLATDIVLNVPSWGEIDGAEWYIACRGVKCKSNDVDVISINPEHKEIKV